jgi:HK97 family phage portal protein
MRRSEMFDGLKSMITRRKGIGGMLNIGDARVLLNRSYSVQASEGYSKCAYVYACVGKISRSVASVPIILYQGEKELANHPLLKLLDRPNPMQSGTTFAENETAYWLLNGNSYTYAPPNTVLPPQELYAMRPDQVQPIEGSRDEPISRYQYSNKYGSLTIAPDDCLHMMAFNPTDELRGLSPLVAAALAVAQNNESHLWNIATLQNGGRPSGILSTSGNLNDKQRQTMKDEIRSKYGGAKNASKIMVLEAGMTWTQAGMTAEEMAWIEGITLSAREISIVYGVPPEIIGDSSNKTYSNYMEANKAFWRETVLPIAQRRISEYNNWLVPKFKGDLRLAINTDDIEALQEDREKQWTRINTASWLTINEKRAATGYPPIGDEGDVILVPATNLPLEYAAAQIEEPKA